jgi:cytochrome P450
MPTIIFGRLAGYPEHDWPIFDRWIDEIIYERTAHPETAYAAGRELNDYFDRLLDEREKAGPDGEASNDLISQLLKAEVKGRKLTREELLSYSVLLLPALPGRAGHDGLGDPFRPLVPRRQPAGPAAVA